MASGTTRRVIDGAPVAWVDAEAAWAAAARPILERVAAIYGAYLTYEQLAEEVQEASGIRTGVPFRHWVGKVLGGVSAAQHAPDEPMLASLVVRADGTIGDGYGGGVAERDGVEPADLDLHAAEERLRCYRHFGADIPPDGGRAMLTRQVEQRRKRSGRRRRPARQPVCPACHLLLPMTGSCDNCDA